MITIEHPAYTKMLANSRSIGKAKRIVFQDLFEKKYSDKPGYLPRYTAPRGLLDTLPQRDPSAAVCDVLQGR
jgi:hypothetical protein